MKENISYMLIFIFFLSSRICALQKIDKLFFAAGTIVFSSGLYRKFRWQHNQKEYNQKIFECDQDMNSLKQINFAEGKAQDNKNKFSKDKAVEICDKYGVFLFFESYWISLRYPNYNEPKKDMYSDATFLKYRVEFIVDSIENFKKLLEKENVFEKTKSNRILFNGLALVVIGLVRYRLTQKKLL